MSCDFPRTEVAGVSLPRMIIGSNWILGYSHTSPAADQLIKTAHTDPAATAEMLCAFLSNGVDALMAPLEGSHALLQAVRIAEDKTGRKMILIDTPILNVDDNAAARREAETVIANGRKNGADFCLIHHTCAEQLVDKNKRTLERLPDYTQMIREQGMIPGLSAHMPELIVYSDQNGYDVQTYIQIYNCAGFLMQVEIEYVHKIIWEAKKPVMTIKPMAAGRVSPFVGLTFSWSTLRPCDMVTVGCLSPREALEDLEISRAAFEHRPPDLEGRASPQKSDVMK